MPLFVIPQCSKTVSIAQEYLDKAPESVLAIAAQRRPPDSITVSLKDWPDANVDVWQAVISCLSDHKVSENMAKIQESQLLRALGYFNLPDSMWPTGLYVRHTHGRTCDKLANQLMNTIKADFVKMAREEKCHAATICRSYQLVYSNVSEETYLKDSVCSKGEKNLLMSSTLKSHLSELAVAECLGITLWEEVSGLRVGRICQHTIIEVSVIV